MGVEPMKYQILTDQVKLNIPYGNVFITRRNRNKIKFSYFGHAIDMGISRNLAKDIKRNIDIDLRLLVWVLNR